MSRRKELCDDPDCPARVSCTYAYTRSAEHAAVSNRSVPMRRRERRPGDDACGEWKLDRPRQWLLAEAGVRTEPQAAEEPVLRAKGNVA